MATVRIASVSPWTRSRALGKASLVIPLLCFCGIVIMSWHSIWTTMEMLVSNFNCFRYYFIWTWFVITFNHTLIVWNYICELYVMWYVCWIMYDLGCILVESRPFMVLDELSGSYELKYDSATTCGLLLYLCSYKLDGSATLAKDILVRIRDTYIPWTSSF